MSVATAVLHVCKRVNAIKDAFQGLHVSSVAVFIYCLFAVLGRGYFEARLKIQV